MLNLKPVDYLISQLSMKQEHLILETLSFWSLNGLFKEVFYKEPRLLALVDNYHANCMRRGSRINLDITVQYHTDAPNLADVELDTGTWIPDRSYGIAAPKNQVMVTTDSNRISKLMEQGMYERISRYEGILGYDINSVKFDLIKKYQVLHIDYSYIANPVLIGKWRLQAEQAARNIWMRILGNADIAEFAKPFLAVSYLAQECAYDQRAFDEVLDDPKKIPTDPIPSLSYGPLVEKRGICGGFAWAFKRMMDVAGITCVCVPGYLRSDRTVGHMWNLVRLQNGSWQHVDPSNGISTTTIPGTVDVTCLMQTDNSMRATHEWEEMKFPDARGVLGSYDRVEDYLAENGTDFLSNGASRKYLFPDTIID